MGNERLEAETLPSTGASVCCGILESSLSGWVLQIKRFEAVDIEDKKISDVITVSLLFKGSVERRPKFQDMRNMY